MSDRRSRLAFADHDRSVRAVMRILVLSALALLGACTQQQAGRCDFTETRQVAFTSAEAQDRITVRSFGVSCDKAVGVYEIIDAEGHPIWAWAIPLQRAFADVFRADEPKHMQKVLEEWA